MGGGQRLRLAHEDPRRHRGTLFRWTGCKDGATFEHLRVAGARHIELFTDLQAAGIDPLDTTWRFLEPFTTR